MRHILFRIVACFCFVIGVSLMTATAQTTEMPKSIAPQVAPVAAAAAVTPTSRATADEDFDLNISERHITERNFSAATNIELGGDDARGIVLRAGVTLGAQEIDVLLRNVRGHVRFRASLEPLLSRLRRTNFAATAPSNAPPNNSSSP